jgi:enamine deaminase RidA (YjgF/YER057c/UK114 family)
MNRIDVNHRRSRAVVAGNIVFLGGQTPSNKDGDIRAQAQDVMAKVDELLAAAGSDRSKIIQCIIWLKTMDDYNEFNLVWDEWIDNDNPPCRACGVVGLANEAYRVEMIVTAMV